MTKQPSVETKDINHPTIAQLEKDAYKKFGFTDSNFYVTEYGCFTEKDGVVELFEGEESK